MRPTPIFMLGLKGAGTVRMADLLAAHPQVAAIRDDRLCDIRESAFFSYFAKAWDWTKPEERREALTAFLNSGYGRLLDLSDAEKARLDRCEKPGRAFQLAMDCLADRRCAFAWLEKSLAHMHVAVEIATDLPDARFVAVHTNTVSLVATQVRASQSKASVGYSRWKTILRSTLISVYHRKLLSRFATVFPGRVCIVDHQAFDIAGDASIERLLTDLGLASHPGLVVGARSASGAQAGDDSATCLSWFERNIIAGLETAIWCVPFSLLDTVRNLMVHHKIVFPHRVWSSGTGAQAARNPR